MGTLSAPRRVSNKKRSVLIIEDSENMRENIKRKLDAKCNIALVKDPGSFKEIIAVAIFNYYNDVLIDVDLNNFVKCQFDEDLSVYNGIDIANILRRFLAPSVTIALLSTNIHSPEFQKSISLIQPNIKIFDKSEPDIYVTYFTSSLEQSSNDSHADIYLNRDPAQIFKIFGNFAWLIENNGSVQTNGFGPLLEPAENYQQEVGDFNLLYDSEIDKPNLTQLNSAIVFWNFANKKYIHSLFHFFCLSDYKYDQHKPVATMFNYQASISLAKFYCNDEISDEEMVKYLPQLSSVGVFNCQKFIFTRLYHKLQHFEINQEDYKMRVQRCFNINTESEFRIKNIFIGTIEEDEKDTDTVWTNFYSIMFDESKPEPIWSDFLKKADIKIFPGNCFYYIVSENNLSGLARKFEPYCLVN